MTISNAFFNMFGRSPIRPLQEHMTKANGCVEMLPNFFSAVLSRDWEQARKHQQRISELEREADELKKDLRLHLPKGLFLPVPRSDVINLLMVQDKVANCAEDIAGLIIGRKMAIPSELAEGIIALQMRSIDASRQALKAINELDELLETGFSGNEVNVVEEMIVKLDDIERDTDEMQIKLRENLFELENNLPPVEVMFLYKIIELIGELADRAQTVGGQLQLLLAR